MNSVPYPERWQLEFARGWLMLGNFREALSDLEKLPAPWLDHPEALEIRCRVLLEQRQWHAALDLLTEQVLTAPDQPMNWIYFSYCLHELGDTARAMGVLDVASRKFPRHALVHHNLACYLERLGRRQEALRVVKRALSLARP